MIMSDLPWFKVYPEALHDPKFIVAATDNQMDKMTVFGIWMAILCIAARSPDRGKLVASGHRNYTLEQLDAYIGWHGNMGTGDLGSLIESFIDLDMIEIDENGTYCITNFELRQETKEERTKRLNRERQLKYQHSHKGDDSVINNVINNASLTQDSISISISDSISSYSLTDEKSFSLFDCERLYMRVTGQFSIPSKARDKLSIILDTIQEVGIEETESRMKKRWGEWIGKKTKEGMPYSQLNPGWIDYILVDEALGAGTITKQIDDYEHKILEEQARRFNQ